MQTLEAIAKRRSTRSYKPEQLSVEELFWNTNQKTGITVAEARGAILLAVVANSTFFTLMVLLKNDFRY